MKTANLRIVGRKSGGGRLKLRHFRCKNPDQPLDFRRAPVEDLVDDRLLLAGRAAGLVISLSTFFCWRRTSAVQ